jgi:hypothetical protein
MTRIYIGLAIAAVLAFTHWYSWDRGYNYADNLCDAAKWKSQVDVLARALAKQKRAAQVAERERDDLKVRESELEANAIDYERQLSERPEPEEGKPKVVFYCKDPPAARAVRKIQ